MKEFIHKHSWVVRPLLLSVVRLLVCALLGLLILLFLILQREVDDTGDGDGDANAKGDDSGGTHAGALLNFIDHFTNSFVIVELFLRVGVIGIILLEIALTVSVEVKLVDKVAFFQILDDFVDNFLDFFLINLFDKINVSFDNIIDHFFNKILVDFNCIVFFHNFLDNLISSFDDFFDNLVILNILILVTRPGSPLLDFDLGQSVGDALWFAGAESGYNSKGGDNESHYFLFL